MTVTVYPMSIPPVTEIWVRQYRFLAELHTVTQQIALDAAHSEALGLSHSELTSTDQTLMSTNGYPVAALRVIRMSYEHMKALGEKVDLLSSGMTAFFDAAKACGVYGLDSTAADAEIARIKSNVLPT
jgi:hypothetical protein